MKPLALSLAALLLLPALARAQPKIVIIDLDAKTRQTLGSDMPAYRAHHAVLIEDLNRAGARAIGFMITVGENPKQKEATEKLAKAVEASNAPVAFLLWAEFNDGAFSLEPNAAALAKAGQCHNADHREMLSFDAKTGANKPGAAVYQLSIKDQSGQDRLWLGAELAEKTGVGLDGATEQVMIRAAKATGAKEFDKVIRPSIGDPRDIPTISYMDVRTGGSADLLKDAYVLVGDVSNPALQIKNPDPIGKPGLSSMSASHLAAFALRRILEGPKSAPPALR